MTLGPSRGIVTLFGVTIFLGAFLLFQVQLLIGKYILPWYGGVPMVWTTCMLCFQVALLLGYAYAHVIVRRLPGPRQRFLHLSVVAGAIVLIACLAARWGVPLLPGSAWKPVATDAPLWHIVKVLTAAVGAPFLVAATTSPLLQSWFGATYPTTSPYRLYALSNLGSLLALLTYPALFEVWLPLRGQAWFWAASFVIFALGITGCALATRARSSAPALPAERGDVAAAAPRVADWLLWLALAACPSALLLATTNYVSQEIAVIPFLWIIPLSLYLMSFVLTFESERWYVRGVWGTLLALGVTLSAFVLGRGSAADVLLQLAPAALALFAACVVCHGELARTKPAASHLTSFYLALTVGGALGGVLVTLVAPLVFPGIWEYPLGLWLVSVLALVTFARDRRSPLYVSPRSTLAVAVPCALAVAAYVFRWSLPWKPHISDAWLFGVPSAVAGAGLTSQVWIHRRRRPDASDTSPPRRAAVVTGAVALGVLIVGVALGHVAWQALDGTVEHARSFYGMVYVEAYGREDGRVVRLRHGRITHGTQYQTPDLADEPTTYYGRDSGIGLAIENHPKREPGLRIGVVGLGAGTIAAYGTSDDVLRFYELNPDVMRLSGRDGRAFTYVHDTQAAVEIVGGDARVALEGELARGMPQRFDVLAIDAFSSDAIPMHLLTREAVAVYLAHLDADGILALHITNRHVGLEPVVRGLAKHFGLAYAFIASTSGSLTWGSDWALLARDPARLAVPEIVDAASFELSAPPVVVWTDDHSNLLSVLRW